MPTYITLVNWTEQGIRNVKDAPKRVDAFKQALQGMGGQLKGVYLTMGAYDLVVISEAPDDQTVAKLTLTVGSQGNVRTMTLKAFNETEFRNIVNTLS